MNIVDIAGVGAGYTGGFTITSVPSTMLMLSLDTSIRGGQGSQPQRLLGPPP